MGVVASCQKLGIILENKVMLSKNVIYKRCAPKFVFFNEKKIRKIPVIFDMEKSNFGTFWHLSTTPIHKIQYFPLGMVIFSQKTF